MIYDIRYLELDDCLQVSYTFDLWCLNIYQHIQAWNFIYVLVFLGVTVDSITKGGPVIKLGVARLLTD